MWCLELMAHWCKLSKVSQQNPNQPKLLVHWFPSVTPKFRRVKSTPGFDIFEKYSDTPPISMSYFCKSMPSSWQKVVYTPPICITIRLPFASRYFCGSIRVRGRWNTPNKWGGWSVVGSCCLLCFVFQGSWRDLEGPALSKASCYCFWVSFLHQRNRPQKRE